MATQALSNSVISLSNACASVRRRASSTALRLVQRLVIWLSRALSAFQDGDNLTRCFVYENVHIAAASKISGTSFFDGVHCPIFPTAQLSLDGLNICGDFSDPRLIALPACISLIGLKGEIPYARMTSEGLLTSDLNGLFDRG